MFHVCFTCCPLTSPAPQILPCGVDPVLYRSCSHRHLHCLSSLVGLPDISCFLAGLCSSFQLHWIQCKIKGDNLDSLCSGVGSLWKFIIDPLPRNWFRTITLDFKLFWAPSLQWNPDLCRNPILLLANIWTSFKDSRPVCSQGDVHNSYSPLGELSCQIQTQLC